MVERKNKYLGGIFPIILDQVTYNVQIVTGQSFIGQATDYPVDESKADLPRSINLCNSVSSFSA